VCTYKTAPDNTIWFVQYKTAPDNNICGVSRYKTASDNTILRMALLGKNGKQNKLKQVNTETDSTAKIKRTLRQRET
jgi:hypothetical protein